MHYPGLFLGSVLLALAASGLATAQSLPAGVINAPPTAVGNNASMGSNTTLNVLTGGSVGRGLVVGAANGTSVNVALNVSGGSIGANASLGSKAFIANGGSVVQISGGIIGMNAEANAGSVVHISGGTIGVSTFFSNDYAFGANTGSVVAVSGGTFGRGFYAAGGSQVNVSGGAFGPDFKALSGSNVSISGGSIAGEFWAYGGSNVDVTGGGLGIRFRADPGSDVSFFGGEFLVNGLVPADPQVTLTGNDVLSGTLEDGTSFVFSPQAADIVRGVNLVNTTMPAVELSPIAIEAASFLSSARQGQTLNVNAGGSLRNDFVAVGATLNMAGGVIGNSLELSGTQLNLNAGVVGTNAMAYRGSEVNVNGGVLGSTFRALADSVVNVNGGTVDRNFFAMSGSTINVAGGRIGDNFDAQSGSEVVVTGGRFGEGMKARAGSAVSLHGGEFLMNGVAPTGGVVTLQATDVLTGTLADGSAFLFTPLAGDLVNEVTLVSSALPAINPNAQHIVDSSAPSSLRAGETLVLEAGGVLADDFVAVDSQLQIAGGVVGSRLKATGGTVSITGGVVGTRLKAYAGSVVEIAGGQVGAQGAAYRGSEVIVSGGQLGADFRALDGSLLRVTAGSVGDNLTGSAGSRIDISGGSVGGGFRVEGGAEVLIAGGIVGNNFRGEANSTIRQTAGQIGSGFAVLGSVEISGGKIGADVDVFGTANISSGEIGNVFEAKAGSQVEISAGKFGEDFNANSGSVVNITGGEFGEGFYAQPGSAVNIRGGTFGLDFNAFSQTGAVSLHGGEFLLNGQSPAGSTITLTEGWSDRGPDVLTGTLANGDVFLFAAARKDRFDASSSDSLVGAKLVQVATPAYQALPRTIHDADGPRGVRSGETLNVAEGGILRDGFTAIGGVVNVAGGRVGNWAEVANTTVNLSTGSFGSNFRAFVGSQVNVSGGETSDVTLYDGGVLNVSGGRVAGNLRVEIGGELNISGGVLDYRIDADDGSTINISGGELNFIGVSSSSSSSPNTGLVSVSGGSVYEFDLEYHADAFISGGQFGAGGGSFTAGEKSNVTIAGGEFAGAFRGIFESEVHLIGSDFKLDGVPVTPAAIGQKLIVGQRDQTLSGILADGSAFDVFLRTASPGTTSIDYFSSQALLTLTWAKPGDFNGDSAVDGADFLQWQRKRAIGPTSQADLANWKAAYGTEASSTGGQAAIPEPSSMVVCLWLAGGLVAGRLRSVEKPVTP